ncbi:MAG: ScpA family protein [Pseudomonadota bacterium]
MSETVIAKMESGIRVMGEAFTVLPEDLYIPPDALEVFLETFQGPLDLLLYLIRKQNLNILDIPIVEVTRQYMQYVNVLNAIKIELAADYLVMAALLAEIKSRLLLPRQVVEETGEELDPRAELVRRLQDYERFKQAAEDLEALPHLGRDRWMGHIAPPQFDQVRRPDLNSEDVFRALADIFKRASLKTVHTIQKEPLSVRARMTTILTSLQGQSFVLFTQFLKVEEGRTGVVVTFLAMLELVKEGVLDLMQSELFGPIYIKSVVSDESEIEPVFTSAHH